MVYTFPQTLNINHQKTQSCADLIIIKYLSLSLCMSFYVFKAAALSPELGIFLTKAVKISLFDASRWLGNAVFYFT